MKLHSVKSDTFGVIYIHLHNLIYTLQYKQNQLNQLLGQRI